MEDVSYRIRCVMRNNERLRVMKYYGDSGFYFKNDISFGQTAIFDRYTVRQTLPSFRRERGWLLLFFGRSGGHFDFLGHRYFQRRTRPWLYL